MPLFEYRGLNAAGKNIKGTLDAENSRVARARLKKDGIFVVDIKDKTKTVKKDRGPKVVVGGGVSVEELSMMTRQLATLLKANVPLVESLTAVAEQVENVTLSEAISDIKNQVNEGISFHKGIGKYPKIFNKIYVSMSEAGEMSGTLDVILIRLAEFTEAQSELNAKIRSALAYPIFIVVFVTLILMGLFVYVIPKITAVYDATPEMVMPWYTKLVFDMSGFMVDYWWVLIVGAFLSYAIFFNWKRTPSGAAQWDAIILKMPIVGKLARTIAVSRFSRTLSTLLRGGVPMLAAMGIVRNVVNNEVLASAIDIARDNISEGESIAGPLKKSGQFPPLILHMINIGEKTGELEKMLTQVSDAYDYQVKNDVEGLTSLLGPIMIVVMGCVIGFIV
ncbi:MAG: type II secretion system F family protein, partial [Bdellovibrionota bacterium]